MVWDIDSSQNGMFMVVRWSIIFRMIIMVVKLWVCLMLDVILDVWFFMVVNMGDDWLVMLVVVAILVVQVMVVVVFVMMIVMVIVMLNIVVNWLMNNLVVHFMMDWHMNNRLMMVLFMVDIMVNWAVVNFMTLNMVWGFVVKYIIHMAWLYGVLVRSPLCVMLGWVVLLVMGNFMVIIVCPGVVVSWLMHVLMLNFMVVRPSIMVSIMLMLMMVIMMIEVMMLP